MIPASLELDRDGAQLHRELAAGILASLETAISGFAPDKAGTRIIDCPPLSRLLGDAKAVGALAQSILGSAARPVRAILFDKSPRVNWALDWHQDRTIAVAGRHDAPGFTNWNCKQGVTHVEPPYALLAGMLTARIHLDRADADNGVLEVIAGSHALGKITEDRIDEILQAGAVHRCPAERGDVWLYRTPVIHRSARSNSQSRRRVLQVDYSADDLPPGLAWKGI